MRSGQPPHAMRVIWIFPSAIVGKRHGHGSGHIVAFVTGCKVNNDCKFSHKIRNLLVIINNFCSNRGLLTTKWQESQEGR